MDAPTLELFDQAVAGDKQALGSLLEQHGPSVRKMLNGQIGREWQSVLDPDDVMQVTYLEAFLRIDRLRARDAASFTCWLLRIAQNNLRDAVTAMERSRRPPPSKRVYLRTDEDTHVALLDLLGATTTTPTQYVAQQETVDFVDSAIGRLPADYARVLRLYDLEGRSARDVAASMHRSVGAIHMLRCRAHDRLRELLEPSSRFFNNSP
ncbi:MAG: RNA polymerase sigma factor [Phycisphaerae bacterium]